MTYFVVTFHVSHPPPAGGGNSHREEEFDEVFYEYRPGLWADRVGEFTKTGGRVGGLSWQRVIDDRRQR